MNIIRNVTRMHARMQVRGISSVKLPVMVGRLPSIPPTKKALTKAASAKKKAIKSAETARKEREIRAKRALRIKNQLAKQTRLNQRTERLTLAAARKSAAREKRVAASTRKIAFRRCGPVRAYTLFMQKTISREVNFKEAVAQWQLLSASDREEYVIAAKQNLGKKTRVRKVLNEAITKRLGNVYNTYVAKNYGAIYREKCSSGISKQLAARETISELGKRFKNGNA